MNKELDSVNFGQTFFANIINLVTVGVFLIVLFSGLKIVQDFDNINYQLVGLGLLIYCVMKVRLFLNLSIVYNTKNGSLIRWD